MKWQSILQIVLGLSKVTLTVDMVLSHPLHTALSTELSGYDINSKTALLVCYYHSEIKDSCTEMIKGLF